MLLENDTYVRCMFQYQNGCWDLLFWYCICPTQPIFTNTETAILSLSPQSRQVAWFMSSELRNEIFSKKLVTNILLQCYFMRYIVHFLVPSQWWRYIMKLDSNKLAFWWKSWTKVWQHQDLGFAVELSHFPTFAAGNSEQ